MKVSCNPANSDPTKNNKTKNFLQKEKERPQFQWALRTNDSGPLALFSLYSLWYCWPALMLVGLISSPARLPCLELAFERSLPQMSIFTILSLLATKLWVGELVDIETVVHWSWFFESSFSSLFFLKSINKYITKDFNFAKFHFQL